MNKHNQKGFTLVEGIIVLVAFTALLVVSIFIQRGYSQRGKNNKALTSAGAYESCGQSPTVFPDSPTPFATSTYVCIPTSNPPVASATTGASCVPEPWETTTTVNGKPTKTAISTCVPAGVNKSPKSVAPSNTVDPSKTAFPTASSTTSHTNSPTSSTFAGTPSASAFAGTPSTSPR